MICDSESSVPCFFVLVYMDHSCDTSRTAPTRKIKHARKYHNCIGYSLFLCLRSVLSTVEPLVIAEFSWREGENGGDFG